MSKGSWLVAQEAEALIHLSSYLERKVDALGRVAFYYSGSATYVLTIVEERECRLFSARMICSLLFILLKRESGRKGVADAISNSSCTRLKRTDNPKRFESFSVYV